MTPQGDTIRVLIVDDHEVVRTGLATTLDREVGIAVAGEASGAEEALAAADQTEPDVVVMDVKLADTSGIEATRDILTSHPEIKVLMFTSYADDEAVFASLLAGAAGYVLKRSRADELVRAIRTVGAGESLLDPAVTHTVLDHIRKNAARATGDDRLARLSPQEERVLELIAEGMTNRNIGAELALSPKTVKNYVSAILAKLEVVRRAEAAAYLAARRRNHIARDPL